MAIQLYMDHNVPRSITNGLIMRGVDVLTAFEDDSHTIDDGALLDRATHLGRILFTFDDDLLVETNMRHVKQLAFSGVIYAHQLNISIGKCIQDLELIAKVGEPQDFANTVQFLPL